MPLRHLLLLSALVLTGLSLRAGEPEAQESAELDHLYRLSERLYSGSQPVGEEGFAALQKLGVKTIISVDGARTEVELAKKYGMRYVHRPIGYEGLSSEQSMQIVKAASSLEGPVYVHCHHGKHRGPAGAAVCAIALEDWTPQEATAWLKQAGTSPSYAGLYRSVAQFQKPTPAELAAVPEDFPAQVEPASFIESMVHISHTHDRLKALAANDYRRLDSAPDLTAAHESLQLHEHYRELMRTDEYIQHDDDLQEFMQQAEKRSARLHELLKRLEKQGSAADAELRNRADRVMGMVSENCKSCHATFRDGRAVK